MLISVLILAVTLIITLGTVALFSGEISISGEVGRSVIAIYAADAGMECFLYKERRDPDQECLSRNDGTEFTDGSGMEYVPDNFKVVKTDTLGRAYAVIKSIGVFGATRRSLEVKYCEAAECTIGP